MPLKPVGKASCFLSALVWELILLSDISFAGVSEAGQTCRIQSVLAVGWFEVAMLWNGCGSPFPEAWSSRHGWQAARTASASWWVFELPSVNPHSAGVTYPPSPCVWSVTLSQRCHFWCADQGVPFLDIQLCLDSSGGQLVPRKEVMEEGGTVTLKRCTVVSVLKGSWWNAGPELHPLQVKMVWVCLCFPGTCSRLGITGLLGTGDWQLIFSGAAR